MNDPISWDPSLVKKFSSSNYYKLLNQLRNEVKKYPLNNKKKTSSLQHNESNIDNKNKTNISFTQKTLVPKSNNYINDENSNKSTISFNNARNFSIYDQKYNNNFTPQHENFLSAKSKSIDETSTPSFKERFKQIDLK